MRGAGTPAPLYPYTPLFRSEVAPSANFSGNPLFGQAPLKVTFVDSSTGWITNRLWDFGDGTTTNTTATSVSHTYATRSTNSVTLVASGPTGTSLKSRANYIVVTDQLVITAINISGANVLISFTSQAGKFYRVEYSDSLS